MKPRVRTQRIHFATLTARRRRAMVTSMLNAYYDLRRSAWIACAIIDGEWIEGRELPNMGRGRLRESVPDRRRALLVAALGFLSLEGAAPAPALAALHRYLDSWAGIGRIVVPLDRDGYRLMLSKITAGEWRAQLSRDAMTSSKDS